MSNSTTEIGIDVDKARVQIGAAADLEDARMLASIILDELVESRQALVDLYASGRVRPTAS